MYTTEGMARELRQCEVMSDVVQHIFDATDNGTLFRRMPYVIILAQDCDLLRDYDSRTAGGPDVMNGVLLYEMETEAQARADDRPGGKINTGIWRQIEGHNHERYHCLASITAALDLAGLGTPRLLIDFRRYFTIPARELERQINLPDGAKRRCRVDTPYREHLQGRAAFYFQRVTLPDPIG